MMNTYTNPVPSKTESGATFPEDLKRQSGRVQIQISQLNKMLDTITSNLEGMSKMMGKYSPELVTQFDNLKSYLENYKGKTGEIYTEISDCLAKYANNIINNLDNLTKSVETIGKSIENL